MKNVGKVEQSKPATQLNLAWFVASQIWVLPPGKYLQARINLSVTARVVFWGCCIYCACMWFVWMQWDDICKRTYAINSSSQHDQSIQHAKDSQCLEVSLGFCCWICKVSSFTVVYPQAAAYWFFCVGNFAGIKYSLWFRKLTVLCSGRSGMNSSKIIKEKIISHISQKLCLELHCLRETSCAPGN